MNLLEISIAFIVLSLAVYFGSILASWHRKFWNSRARKDPKKYFQGKLLSTKQSLWDLNFQLSRMEEIREGVRREYDRLKENDDIAQRKISESKDKDERKRFKKLREEKYQPDLEQLEKQIQSLDAEIENKIQPQVEGTEELINLLEQQV